MFASCVAVPQLPADLVAPPPVRPGTCAICRNPISLAYRQCYRCSRQPQHLDAVVPIAVSIAGGGLRQALRGYKNAATPSRRKRCREQLAEILARFVASHERCVAASGEVTEFDLVTTVPFKRRDRDPMTTLVEVGVHLGATICPFAGITAAARR
jgi:predicted amidophosphoribosyltransferase